MTSELGEAAAFEGSPIVGHAQLTAEDFTSVWAALPQNRRLFGRLGLWVVLIAMFWLVHRLLSPDGASAPLPWTILLVPVVMAVVFPLALWRGRNVWAKNAVADLRGGEGVEFRFDESGFSFNAPGRQIHHAWSALYRCVETAQGFAIYTAPAAVMVVPKRAFAAEDQARLRAQLLANVPNRPLRGTRTWPPRNMVLLWVVLVVVFLALWQVLDSK
jgi:hypothetical protein